MNSRTLRLALALLVFGSLLLWQPYRAAAQIGAEYSFSSASVPYASISGGNLVIAGNSTTTPSIYNDNEARGPYDIGFPFAFGCNTYTQFSVASAGYMVLGGSGPINQNANNLAGAPLYPIISPFWDHQHYYDNYTAAGCAAGGPAVDVGVRYLLSGTAPNRVLTVEWKTNLGGDAPYWLTCGVPAMHTYQVRLYEGTNAVALHYGLLVVPGNANANSSVSIGIAAASNDFLSITPGAPANASSTTVNNAFNNRLAGIAAGTQYTFTPDRLVLAGRTGPGNEGVTNPVDGSELFGNVVQSISTQTGYTPLELRKACAAAAMPLSMTITGTNAAEYTFDATGTQSWNTSLTNNSPLLPRINFLPQGGGVRSAVLTITNQRTNRSFSFTLAAEGQPRIVWTGNQSDGGTANVADGDVLLDGIQVVYGNERTFRPLTLRNILDPGIPAPPAPITYTLVDPTGSYSIAPSAAALDGGETSTPDIVFSATHGVGTQEATLIVTAEGETRTYTLRAFAAAPGGELYIGGERLDSTRTLFAGRSACVGEQVISLEVTAVNTGTGDFIIHGLDAFRSETEIRQGVPPYPLLRDEFDNVIPTQDYFLSLGPGVAPRDRNQAFPGLTVPERGTRTFYLNIIPSRPDKRFAHLYFRTNGFNLNYRDTEGMATRGLLRTNSFAVGVGAHLSDANLIDRPQGVVIPATDVRHERTVTTHVANTGDCDLRISRSELRFSAGDIQDFELVEALPNTAVSGEDYVLPPGASDSLVIRFRPQTYGSRRVTLRLATNDSTIGAPGVTERGVYYWDIYGKGDVGVEARGVQLAPAVINGTGSQGFVVFENTSGELIEIEGLNLVGGTGEIRRHSGRPWPSSPVFIEPGKNLRLWVEMKADPAGTPGVREADVVVRLKGGKTATAHVSGYIGTRLLSVLPGTLFGSTKIAVGELARQYVSITNVGTLPVYLNDPVLVETNPGDYRVNPLLRRALEPGQTEVLEVTYAPQGAGVSGGTLSFSSNSTNGTQDVVLGGEATSGTAAGNPGFPTVQATPGDNMGRLGAGAAESGLHLYAVAPNPVSQKATIRYVLPAQSEVRLAIYDPAGRLIREVAVGLRDGGEHVEDADVSALPAGQYYIVLVNGDKTLSRAFNIIR